MIRRRFDEMSLSGHDPRASVIPGSMVAADVPRSVAGRGETLSLPEISRGVPCGTFGVAAAPPSKAGLRKTHIAWALTQERDIRIHCHSPALSCRGILRTGSR